MKQNGKYSILLGDETWKKFAPHDFSEKHSFSSFNDYDYDGVDKYIEKHIAPALTKKKFNLLIAHCEGVDHIGHTTHSNTKLMGDKLK